MAEIGDDEAITHSLPKLESRFKVRCDFGELRGWLRLANQLRRCGIDMSSARISERAMTDLRRVLPAMSGWSSASSLIALHPFVVERQVRFAALRVTALDPLLALVAARPDGANDEKCRVLLFVNRANIREEGIKMLLEPIGPSMVEVRFTGEEGIGPGPTRGFVTAMATEFQSHGELWRRSQRGDEYYPAPVPREPEAAKRYRTLFRALGVLCGRAIGAGVAVALTLSRAFFKSIDGPIALSEIDPDQAASLERMCAMEDKKVAECCLTFVLPGYEDWELVEGGADRELASKADAESLLQLVTKVTTHRVAIEEWSEGFHSVVAHGVWDRLTPEDRQALVCGDGSPVSVEDLRRHAKLEGYALDDPQIEWLFSWLSEGGCPRFWEFVTGVRRLPAGGLPGLPAQFTVAPLEGGDGVLPTARTCTCVLRLPRYSSRTFLVRRVEFACAETGGFELT